MCTFRHYNFRLEAVSMRACLISIPLLYVFDSSSAQADGGEGVRVLGGPFRPKSAA